MNLAMLSEDFAKLRIKNSIKIYLEHSQNENNHAFIEMVSKGKMIYTPSNWELLIQTAFNNVIMLCYDGIIDCKS